MTALAIGVAGLAVSLFGVATQVMPRHFSAAQQRQITDWEYGKRWRVLPASQIFPALVKYTPPVALGDDQSLTLAAHRLGIARPSTCKAATDAAAAAHALAGAGGTGGTAPGVHAVAFNNTPAAWFTDQRRQLSGSMAAGDYVILYTVGYADSRPHEPVSGDAYADAEMTNAGQGVAHAVLSVLGAPVAPAHCPGTPGC